MINFDQSSLEKEKMRSDDRIIVLEPIDGQNKVKDSTGLVDPRLWKGGNRLHAVIDEFDGLWKMKYDAGGLPPALKQKFTSFAQLLRHATPYFEKRGLRIKEIND